MQAVIFDLDGVIVSTDHLHYKAWKAIADEESIPFDETVNNRLRGISRMESLEIILEKAARPYTGAEKQALAEKKNELYRGLLATLSPADILPGVAGLLAELKTRGIKVAIGSSSSNTQYILAQIGLAGSFDAVADGNGIQNSKPHPEVFLLAAAKLGLAHATCVVIEDAEAGIKAARAAGMRAVAVGAAQDCQLSDLAFTDAVGVSSALDLVLQ